MGKIRVKTIDETEGQESKPQEGMTPAADEKKTAKKTSSPKQTKGKKYLEKAAKVEKTKAYKLQDALSLLPEVAYKSFDETVELHINTTETGVSGSMTLPHGTGKQIRVAIADDALIAEIEKGTINFDILLAEPQMMPKLAKVARVLGPRGLMPNPKNGTVHPNPTDAAKRFEGGLMNFKTEVKFPLLHLSVGKLSFGNEKLAENIKVAIDNIQKKNIKSITLKSTMSPGLKLDLSSL